MTNPLPEVAKIPPTIPHSLIMNCENDRCTSFTQTKIDEMSYLKNIPEEWKTIFYFSRGWITRSKTNLIVQLVQRYQASIVEQMKNHTAQTVSKLNQNVVIFQFRYKAEESTTRVQWKHSETRNHKYTCLRTYSKIYINQRSFYNYTCIQAICNNWSLEMTTHQIHHGFHQHD